MATHPLCHVNMIFFSLNSLDSSNILATRHSILGLLTCQTPSSMRMEFLLLTSCSPVSNREAEQGIFIWPPLAIIMRQWESNQERFPLATLQFIFSHPSQWVLYGQCYNWLFILSVWEKREFMSLPSFRFFSTLVFPSSSLIPFRSRLLALFFLRKGPCLSHFYLLEIERAEFGLLPELPFALRVCIVQLTGQLLGVSVLLHRPGLVR